RVMEKVGRWDETLYISDHDYWLRAAWAGCLFCHCPGSPMGFARRRSNQMSANHLAMAKGVEVVFEKALLYVTREPYRRDIIRKLARERLHLATTRYSSSQRERLVYLARARIAVPGTIPFSTYAIAYLAVVLPGGIALMQYRWLRPIGLALTRALRSCML